MSEQKSVWRRYSREKPTESKQYLIKVVSGGDADIEVARYSPGKPYVWSLDSGEELEDHEVFLWTDIPPIPEDDLREERCRRGEEIRATDTSLLTVERIEMRQLLGSILCEINMLLSKVQSAESIIAEKQRGVR